ncbi:hypothetical protein AMTRI_Chr03g148480 [Amborella trichopoda]|uniref:RING-type domain-containing protein n=1 Tax=Amborella trichopoda TaxID=13333 RepID=W1P3K1_AMBTC|nr:RING-H2 finger protein ATL66 [Amborella trichopoda]ERN01540.1 hypothetical protein AMTR_s00002p00271240 [Amborella trichopoda]|eukprot:XP_006838971.1 RING-H2 finger protein ATL66 [Amborella trichopoda]
MAGMLPGVEAARRRKTHSKETHVERWAPRSRRFEEDSSTMGEAALKARRNLDSKLGNRLLRCRPRDESGSKEERCNKGRERIEMEKEVCGVCLDELESGEGLTRLPCSHSYHSHCLLPWLSRSSHCPYCRAHVPLVPNSL